MTLDINFDKYLQPPIKDKGYWKEKQNQARDILDSLRVSNGKYSTNDTVNDVLKMYGKENDFKNMNEQEKVETAMMWLNHSFLLVTFFDPDGNPTIFHDSCYPNVDPEEYRYIGTSYNSIKDQLIRSAADKRGVNPNSHGEDYGGNIAVSGQSESFDKYDDPVRQFHLAFSTPEKLAIIAIPGTIKITSDHVEINTSDDFTKPFGGTSYERTLFVPIE